jgi:translation elongation factor P/translation initiation factor 5A
MINLTMKYIYKKGEQIALLDNIDYSHFDDPMDLVDTLLKFMHIKRAAISYLNYVIATMEGKYYIAECTSYMCKLYKATESYEIIKK